MSEKNMSNQENRLCDLFRDAVRASGLSKDEAQEIIMNGGTMQLEIKKILQKLTIADKRFGVAIREFELTIPNDYDHDSQIDTSAKKTKNENTTHFYNDALTSKNFAKATNKLIPGKTYKVKIFPILQRVTSEDCMAFLRKQNAILVGGQGATLVYDLAKDQLPKGKWTASFDEKDALWENADGGHGVPSVSARSNGGFKFYLGYFEFDWSDDNCLLCVCDK
jgi:hypothetical protein